MAILKVFKSRIPSCNYVFARGKSAAFVEGRYATGILEEISELEQEILSGHPHIYVDPAETEVDSDAVDPMAALREKIIADYLKNQAAATDPSRDMGKSDQGPVKASNTRDIAVAAAGGNGAAVIADVAKLVGKK